MVSAHAVPIPCAPPASTPQGHQDGPHTDPAPQPRILDSLAACVTAYGLEARHGSFLRGARIMAHGASVLLQVFASTLHVHCDLN
ncbi:hypothetical protein PVAP13_2NG143300 [Panicum virgatum]|uniref:Uncharacterized protein n=1 Tax=Panicum virgatum TaxID=38727 RepID=A0A8T0VDU3_PANVG|nr:hypothetical protein PVAP13_2NG143300 [Panicum virgatum]